jgi:alkanesulfonate monooxygenase SsuD/methylene tetrahydromethanopterin reductase-like flavin-dependent oxidoreductase (luciferase family)
VTERIRLGTLVSPVTFRHPSVLAKTAVTADHVSGGRVELGMGAGWFDREHEAYGFDFPPAAERMDLLAEQVEIVHRMLNPDDEVVSFEGRHYRLDQVAPLPKPFQRPHPPLIIGGQGGPRSVALAARWADEYNTNSKGPKALAELRGRLDQACESADRDPAELPLSLMTGTLVGADQADLEARAGRLAARTGGAKDGAELLASRRGSEITGTVEQVVERLGELAEAGVRRIMMQHLDHEDLDFVALVGREVIPQVESL